jgi:hypothetical protein
LDKVVCVHESGHALAAILYGIRPRASESLRRVGETTMIS